MRHFIPLKPFYSRKLPGMQAGQSNCGHISGKVYHHPHCCAWAWPTLCKYWGQHTEHLGLWVSSPTSPPSCRQKEQDRTTAMISYAPTRSQLPVNSHSTFFFLLASWSGKILNLVKNVQEQPRVTCFIKRCCFTHSRIKYSEGKHCDLSELLQMRE